MSSPATIPRFINMSASSPIDLTISPLVRRTPVEVVIISDTEDDINDPSNNCNNNYNLTGNSNNPNSAIGFDSQNIFNSSTRRSSNNNQDSQSSNTNYNLRSGLAGLGNNRGSNRNTSARSSRAQRPFGLGLNLMLNVTVSSQSNNNRSAFQPYASTEVLFTADDIYGNNNSSGSSRTQMSSFFESARNSNDIQILNTPPSSSRRKSPIPTTLAGHARDLDDSHTLICADCDGLLNEKLWALGSCGHVVCGSCVDKYLGKKKIPCPSCKKNVKTTLQLYV